MPPSGSSASRVAGVLHDIGKIGVSDAILRKPGPLDEDECDRDADSTPRSARASSADAGLDDIREWILAHHERPDGRGYPRGLAGDGHPARGEDPRGRRLLRGDDRATASTASRSGRARRVSELEECSGTQFDPQVVAAFLRVLDRTGAQAAPSARS